jgi:hypothetical protein
MNDVTSVELTGHEPHRPFTAEEVATGLLIQWDPSTYPGLELVIRSGFVPADPRLGAHKYYDLMVMRGGQPGAYQGFGNAVHRVRVLKNNNMPFDQVMVRFFMGDSAWAAQSNEAFYDVKMWLAGGLSRDIATWLMQPFGPQTMSFTPAIQQQSIWGGTPPGRRW